MRGFELCAWDRRSGSRGQGGSAFWRFLRTEIREEVHPQGICELRRRAEREVDILPQHFRDVRPRHVQPRRKLRLRHPELLHPPEYPPQKRRSNMVNRFHLRFFPWRNIRQDGFHGDPMDEFTCFLSLFTSSLQPNHKCQSRSAHSFHRCSNVWSFLNYFPMPAFVWADATQCSFLLEFGNRTRHGTSFHSKHIRHLLRSYKRIRTN